MTVQPTNVLSAVREALDNAKANGYDLTHMTIDDLIIDLSDYDADLAEVPHSDLRAALTTVLGADFDQR